MKHLLKLEGATVARWAAAVTRASRFRTDDDLSLKPRVYLGLALVLDVIFRGAAAVRLA
jgi:hypothetical protein